MGIIHLTSLHSPNHFSRVAAIDTGTTAVILENVLLRTFGLWAYEDDTIVDGDDDEGISRKTGLTKREETKILQVEIIPRSNLQLSLVLKLGSMFSPSSWYSGQETPNDIGNQF